MPDGLDPYWINDWITPDDDFDGAKLDNGRWWSWGNVSTRDGKLAVDSSSVDSGIGSNYKLIGDLDLLIDFSENISYDNGVTFGLGASSWYFNLANIRSGGYSCGFVIYDQVNTWIPTGDYLLSGRFRITRTGTTVIGYGWIGNGWREIYRATDPRLTEPVSVNLGIYRAPPWLGTNSTKYDDLVVAKGTVLPAIQAVNSVRLLPLHDNFEDGVINSQRWTVRNSDVTGQPAGSGEVSETAGALSLALSNASAGESVEAVGREVHSGDYDFQVEWSDFSTTVDGTALELATASDGDNYAYIKRYKSGSAYYYGRSVKVNGAWSGSSSIATTDTKGKFRITRTGSVVRTFYRVGNLWVELGTATASGTQPVTAALRMTMGGSGSAAGKFDDFVAAGKRYRSSGSIRLKSDAGILTSWQKLMWNARQSVETGAKFRTRTADSESDLQTATWSDYLTTSGSNISSPPGRWIEIEAVLTSSNPMVTPLLDDVTVSYGNNPGDAIWRGDIPVEAASGAVSEISSTIGALGMAGKFYLRGTLTTDTGQVAAASEYPFYVEQGNVQLTLAPDKKIYRPGEVVKLAGEVRNLAAIATNGVTARIEGGGGAAPHSETFDLAANGVRPVSVEVPAASVGLYQFTGTVSQGAAVLSKVVDLYEVAAPSLSASLNLPDSAGSAPFNLSLSITNTGKVAASTRVMITDDGGNTIDNGVVTLAAGENRLLQYSRQISATTTYSVALSGDLDKTFTRKVVYQAPVTDSGVSAKIVVDKAGYNPNEAVTLTATVSSASARENLSTLVTVTNSAGQGMFSANSVIATLVQGQTVVGKSYWNSGSHPAGSYLVTLQILDAAGAVLGKATSPLVISSTMKPAALLKGKVTLAKQSILSGEEVKVFYELTNAGNVELTGVTLALRTVDTTEERTYGSMEAEASTLAVGASQSFSGVIDTAGYSAKDYLVVLSATVGGVEETLAGSYFRVQGAPSGPALAGPAAGSDVQTLTPALSVSNAADPNADRLSYQFELYRESALTELAASGEVSETAGGTSWIPSAPLDENGTYYWRVRAFDGLLYGAWMAPASFRVNVANDPPSAPGISGPMEGTAVPVFTPELTVINAADPDSTNLTYNFQVALDPAFAQLVASVRGVASGLSTTSWTVTEGLQENGTYYWRAQADDWLDEGAWSPAARFFVNTANEAPTAPVLLAPAAASSVADLAVMVVAANSGDPDSSPLSYQFEADTVPTFDSAEMIRSGSVPEGDGSTNWQLNGLRDNTRYYLRVKASDGAAESSWSAVTGFFVNTANDAPTTPTLANPSHRGAVNQASPTLAVNNAVDVDTDPLTYEFELYADQAMTDIVAQASGVAEGIGTTGWQVPVALVENGSYFWRARAFDGALHSDWTTPASFMVNTANDAPGAPVPVAPAQGETVTTLLPVLSLKNTTDPEGDTLSYEFEIFSAGVPIAPVAKVPEDASGVTSYTPGAPLLDKTAYQWRGRAHDGDSYGPWSTMSSFNVHIPQSSIGVTLDIDPDTLKKSSNGSWVVAYIEFPAGYRAADVDVESIRLQGTVAAELRPTAVGDYDRDGVPDLMVKFRRADLIGLLAEGERVPLQVTGKVGALQFEGVDLIRVIK